MLIKHTAQIQFQAVLSIPGTDSSFPRAENKGSWLGTERTLERIPSKRRISIEDLVAVLGRPLCSPLRATASQSRLRLLSAELNTDPT